MSRVLTAVFLFIALTGLTAAQTDTTTTTAATAADATSKLSVADWLAKAAQTVRTGDYRGVMVYLRQDQLDTLRIVHRFHDGIEQERLLAMTGRPREIIRNGSRVVTILPQDKVVLITHQKKRGSLLTRVGRFVSKQMQAHYRMQVLDSRRLANRPARVISIEPRDAYRYGYRIVIDEKTFLPLKLNLVSGEHVLEQLMFTEIAYPKDIPDSAFRPSYDLDGFRVIDHQPARQQADDAAPAIAQTRWRLTKLPPGFELVEAGLRRTSGGQAVRQLLFSDGVATVSAFVAPAGVPNPLLGATTMGAVNAFGRKAGAYHITVVGQVPALTVRMIAENLVHVDGRTARAGDHP